MPVVHSSLLRVPIDILLLIATELALLDPLGPPTDLVHLLLTCRQLYHSLSLASAPSLYARIFRCMFDTRAAHRRLGVRATHAHNQAVQLKKVCCTLNRIRTGDIYSQYVEHDLWTAYIMCTENDGKNEAQLRWARADAFVDRFIRNRLWEDRHDGWPAETNVNSLAIWIYWFMLDSAKLASMDLQSRMQIMDAIRPYVLTAIRYPSFHAPDNHFDFPLPEELQTAFPYTYMTPHGFYPLYRQPEMLEETFAHYGIRLDISAPLIAQGAKLLFTTLLEQQFEYLEDMSLTREHAIQLGRNWVGPTMEDIDEINAHRVVKLLEPGVWHWRSLLSEEEGVLEDDGVWRRGLKAKSALWDNGWHQLTGCINPWNIPELKGVVYTYGTLAGLWVGQMHVPESNQYFALVTSTQFPETFSDANPHIATMPVYMNLREHHCINPEFPVACGGHEGAYDDGLCNGWFPASVKFREANGRVRVTDEATGLTSMYETYVEGKPNSHREETCTSCRQRHADEEAELQERVREHRRAASQEAEEGHERRELAQTLVHRRGVEELVARGYAMSREDLMSRADEGEQDAEEYLTEPAWRSQPMYEDEAYLSDMRAQMGDMLGRDVEGLLDEEMADAEGEGEGPHDAGMYEYVGPGEGEDDLEEYIVNTCNGVCDIILTGETLPRHGQAWNHYRFYGRVRRWDGLVAIARVPVQYRQLGVCIFRGYVVGNKNFVGSWRAYADNPNAIPLEGPFVLSKA